MIWQMIFGQKTAMRIQLDQGPVLIKAFTAVTPTAAVDVAEGHRLGQAAR